MNPMDPRPKTPLAPVNVAVIGNELAIAWNDGEESYIRIDFLRRACPCAACGGEPDVLGNVERPNVTYTDKSFDLRSQSLVGGYALQPVWADGHDSGLYSFEFLKKLAKAS